MVPALLGASRVHSPLSSAAPRDDAPGPGLQVRRRASADLGPVHRQVDRRREQEHGGARRGRGAAEGQGARRGRGQAAPHPRGQREDQESLNLDVGAWRNGNRRGFKILCPQGLAGSTPAAPTICTAQLPTGLGATQFPAYSYLLGMYLGDGYI